MLPEVVVIVVCWTASSSTGWILPDGEIHLGHGWCFQGCWQIHENRVSTVPKNVHWAIVSGKTLERFQSWIKHRSTYSECRTPGILDWFFRRPSPAKDFNDKGFSSARSTTERDLTWDNSSNSTSVTHVQQVQNVLSSLLDSQFLNRKWTVKALTSQKAVSEHHRHRKKHTEPFNEDSKAESP